VTGDDDDWTKEVQKVNRGDSDHTTHVTPSAKGGWSVVNPSGGERSHHRTQKDAIDGAREIIKNAGGGEINIYGKDGRIRDKNTIKPDKNKRKKR